MPALLRTMFAPSAFETVQRTVTEPVVLLDETVSSLGYMRKYNIRILPTQRIHVPHDSFALPT